MPPARGKSTAIGVLVGLAAIVGTGCAPDPPESVVGLAVTGCGTGQAHGTGTVVAPGLVLTSAHVVKGADAITVTTRRGDTVGTIVGFDPEMDVAYVQIDAPGIVPARVASESIDRADRKGETGRAYVVRHDEVVVIPVTIRRPITIHTEDIYVDGETYRPGFELDAELEAGDSGGPVMVGGEVVGVLWARSNRFDGRAYAIDPVAAGDRINRQLDEGLEPDIDLTRCV